MSEENGIKMCQACKAKPIWGYAGSGLYVGNLCKRCYKRYPEVIEESSGRKITNGNVHERNHK